jgi:GNAT superfamily N-acetyltransferase
MIELHIFPTSESLPLHFHYQSVSFQRIVWGEGDDFDFDLGLTETATHFVIADGKRLISYASVVGVPVKLSEDSYQCAGLGSVMTFPHFRGRGYGSQLVNAATQFIQTQMTVDIGLLWAEPANHGLYQKHGWKLMPHLITLQGDPANPEFYDEEPALMLFLSDKGKQAEAAFEEGRVYVGEEKW